MVKTVLRIDGMMCGACVAGVEGRLASVDGVNDVKVDLAKKTAVMEHEGVADEALLMAVLDAGFKGKVKRGLLG